MRKRGTQNAATIDVPASSTTLNGASAVDRTIEMFEAAKSKTDPPAQENLSAMLSALETRGYVLTLQDVAGWIVAERAMASAFLKGERETPPSFLSKYVVATTPSRPGLAKAERPSNDSVPVVIEVGDKITVTWGDEKIGIQGTYSSFSVGMISSTVTLKPGESRVEAARRMYDDLEKLGEEFRARKQSSFLKALQGLEREVKS